MAIADDIKKLEAFLLTGGQRYVYEGKTYSFTDAQKLLADLKLEQKPVTAAATEKTTKIEKAQLAVKTLQDELELKLNVFSKPEEYVTTVSESEIRKVQNNLRFANEGLARLTSQTDEALVSRNLVLNTRAEDARLKRDTDEESQDEYGNCEKGNHCKVGNHAAQEQRCAIDGC